MGKTNDLTGRVFTRLTVVKLAGYRAAHAVWNCRCECGREVEVRGTHLVSGRVRSCGCLRADSAIRSAAARSIPKRTRRKRARAAAVARWKKERAAH